MKMIPAALMSAALTMALSSGVLAEQKADGMAAMDMSKMPASTSQTSHPAVGVVKGVDAAAGKVTIAHEAIKGLNWPAMTMTFMVKDKMLFDKLTVDKKVEFQVAKQGADYVVTAVK
jgi:Cu(I)/Ag(I) efflux system periplasmic protein CusF